MAELEAAVFSVRQQHLDQLRALGVAQVTIAQMGRRHFSFGVANCTAHEEGLYYPDPHGRPHLILPVYEDGELMDLVAFQSHAPDQWLLRAGVGWSLGLFDGFQRHWWGGVASLSATPLDWMRDGADGLCVLDWSAPEVSELADLESVHCSQSVATVLCKALTKPPRIPQIILKGEERLAA